MYIRVDEHTVLGCDGHFEVGLTLEAENATAQVRRQLSTRYVVGIEDLALDHDVVTLDPRERHVIRVTGRLTDRCKGGEFSFRWVETAGGQEIPGTSGDVLITVPGTPFRADDLPDPVVADRSGAFSYTVTVKCCPNGVPPQQRAVDYQITTWTGVKRFKMNPASPITLDCPDEYDLIDVVGILEDPKQPGEMTMNLSDRGRCQVVTKISPNASPDRTAHRLALEEWQD